MLRKSLSILVTFALIVTLLPLHLIPRTHAAGTYFIFDNLGSSPGSATQTNDRTIDLEGSYNSVNEMTITYTVEQILNENTNPMTVGLSRANTAAGLVASGGSLSVMGLELFPGLNRITFKGNAGFTELRDTFYIKYIDNPVIYDLRLVAGDGTETVVNHEAQVIVTEDMTILPNTGNINLRGKAPNASSVFIYINDNFSKSFPVLNGEFFAAALKLERGLNKIRFVVENATQRVETTREFIYFNGDVTFFDVYLVKDQDGDGVLDEDGDGKVDEPMFPLTENPVIEADDADDQLFIVGSYIVPNNYELKPKAPKIVSALLNDNDGNGWDNGDTLVITFDRDTNKPRLNDKNDIDELIDWDADGNGTSVILGASYSAGWDDDRTLIISVNDVAGSNVDTAPAIGEDIALLDTDIELKTENGLSDPSTATATIAGVYDSSLDAHIETVLAEDGSNSEGLAEDDKIVITFTAPTNMMGKAQNVFQYNTAEITSLFEFRSADGVQVRSIGNDFYYVWRDPQTLEIIFDNDFTGVDIAAGDKLLLDHAGATAPLTDAGSGNNVGLDGAHYLISGTFGDPADENYEPNPDPNNLTADDYLGLEIFSDGNSRGTAVIDTITQNTTLYSYDNDEPYFVFEFGIKVADSIVNENISNDSDPTNDIYGFDIRYSYTLSSINYVKSADSGEMEVDTASGFSFMLKNQNEPFLINIRHVTNYDEESATANPDYDDLTGVKTNGQNYNVFESPFDLELQSNLALDGTDVTVDEADDIRIAVLDENGQTLVSAAQFTNANGYFTLLDTSGFNDWPAESVVIRINKLPRVGYQVLRIQLDPDDGNTGPTFDQPITFVFGAYVTFDEIYDGMIVEDPDDPDTNAIGKGSLDFTGELFNVDPSTIIDSGDAGTRTIFFSINGRDVPIFQQDTDSDGVSNEDTRKFTLDNPATPIADENVDAQNLLIAGKNTLRFVYQYGGELYVREMTINLFPTDFPEVPAEGTSGIYPTTRTNYGEDPDHFIRLSEGIYSTRETDFAIRGTFRSYRFETSNLTQADVDAIEEGKYRFVIDTPDGELEWDLAVHRFEDDDGTIFNSANRVANLDVIYHEDDDYFEFRLRNQKLEENTGKVVYEFTAYKDTANTYYRLEIQHVDVPYTILRPILPQQRVINQNYLDVVIHSKGAVSISTKNAVGEKIDFDEDNNGSVDFEDAFKIRVKDLKNGRNEIKFTILLESGEEIEGAFEVLYAPTNIAGAQFLEEMGKRHRSFNNTLQLTFPNGTVLMKKNDPTDRNPVNQVYAGHDILLGIANPYNGMVDQRLYEDLPSGFQNRVRLSELQFRATLPARFTMASPLYWIDAGMADDPNTNEFDPVETGFLPFQFASSGLPDYMSRDEDRVLVPSNRGELVLSFDPNIVQNANTLITTFRYDPQLQMWENIGGVVDTRNNTITVPFDQFGYYTVMKLQYSFLDITRHPYARDEMEAIYTKGVMNSFDTQDFGANTTITRAEFATMIVKAMQIPLNYDDTNLHFDDVSTVIIPGALWDYRFVETAAREGIIRGKDPRIFEPYGLLTREEAATMLARAMELNMPTNRENIDRTLSQLYRDYTQISYYSRPAVVAVSKLGLMKGSPVDVNDESQGFVFEPQDSLLRSDAAIMLTRVMSQLKLLPKMN